MEPETAVAGRIDRMLVIRASIVAEHDKTGHDAGKLTCPVCAGTVFWRRNRNNGRIHARCTTPDCASWME